MAASCLKAPQIAEQPVDSTIEAWCKSASGVVFKLAVPRFTEGEFAELATQPARQAFRQREEKAFGDLSALLAETPTLIRDIEQELAELETLLPADETVSTTDFILFLILILRSLTIVKGIHYGPRVSEYLYRVATAAHIDLLTAQAR
ncbi:glutaredoxin [Candidatus Symbiopectobacterium sp.]|uniref:glutaredoxin n=1 Tax=Candidatus Symbiopectobacterium sp. TaxID=2816440 RepID=UPI0025BF1F43|nr:glutaredoxin [Candidatus Symbiopectobacterium sp.]